MAKECRRDYVKQLCAFARELDVEQVRDDCGRSKVTDLFERIKAAATNKKKPELKGKAQKVFESYESTWSVDKGTEAKQDTAVETVRLRGKSLFLTPLRCVENFDSFYATTFCQQVFA